MPQAKSLQEMLDDQLRRFAGSGHLADARRMLDAGAWPQATDEHGMTALMRASQAGHLPLVELLLPLSEVNARDRLARTALICSMQRPNKSVIAALAAAGADIHAQAANQRTALHVLARADWLHHVSGGDAAEAAGELVRLGANLEAPDQDGLAPLLLAAVGGRKEILEALLAAGADATASDKRGRTVLHLAARHASVEAFAAILPAGDVSAKTDRGETVEDFAPTGSRAGYMDALRKEISRREREALLGAVKRVEGDQPYAAAARKPLAL
jgi:ankyrin repeat protein